MNTDIYSPTNLLISFLLTLAIILTPYIIIRLITHRTIQNKTANIFFWVFFVISFIVCSIVFAGTFSIIPVIVWNNIGYFLIKPKKNKSSEKNDADTYSSNDNCNADIDIKTLIDNQPLKEDQIRCNHCGNIQSKNIERCLRCSKIINTELKNQLPNTDTNIQKKIYQNEHIIANLILNTFSKNQLDILTSNKFTICDCVLFCRYLFMNTLQTSQVNQSVNINKLDEFIAKGVHNIYKISETECNEYFKKRFDFYNHIFSDKKNDINSAIEELELLIAHDIVTDEFVEFNESSPIMLTDFDETILIKTEIMQFSSAILQISKTYIERLKTKDSNKNDNTVIPKEIKSDKKRIDKKDKKKTRFKTATIILSITTAVFAISTLCLCFGLINQNTNEQEFTAQIETLEADIKQKDSTISRLNTQIVDQGNTISNLKNNLYFYDSYAVCVNDNSSYYHKPNCFLFDNSSFYIYNTEAAEAKGYRECPYCF